MKSRTNSKILLGYGTYKSNHSIAEFKAMLKAAYLANYDYIDTASYYQNESEIGQALAELKQEIPNFNFPVQTKVWTDDYVNAKEAVLASMKKLQVSVLDSVLLHRPSTNLIYDTLAWEQLVELQKAGLIKEIGVSNYDQEMLWFLTASTNVKPAFNQIEFSLYNARFDRYYSNTKDNIQIQAWRPLTNSLDKLLNDELVGKLALKYNTTPTGIALGYLKALNISPIVKSSNVERINKNAKDFFAVNLEKDDVNLLKNCNFYDIQNGSATYPFLKEAFLKKLAEVKNKK